MSRRPDPDALTQARETLCRYGLELARHGLVARTWGNLSLRLGDFMLITPSGIPYESLEPRHMVLISLATMKAEGDLKPSSEKDLHAAVYRRQPATGAIFHTHQPWASVWAAARKDLVVPSKDLAVLGSRVACAPYALPTTASLAAKVESIVAAGPHRALFLANHGAITMGTDPAGALESALALESACRDSLLALWGPDAPPAGAASPSTPPVVPAVTGSTGHASHRDLLDLAVQLRAFGLVTEPGHLVAGAPGGLLVPTMDALPRVETHPAGTWQPSSSALRCLLPRLGAGASGAAGTPGAGAHPRLALLSRGPFTLLAASEGKAVRPVLDDLAQLVGTRLPCLAPGADVGRAASRMNMNSAILLPGQGALILAADPYEALALALVIEKSCLAHLGSGRLGVRHPIAFAETVLMRFIYRAKYRKAAARLERAEKGPRTTRGETP